MTGEQSGQHDIHVRTLYYQKTNLDKRNYQLNTTTGVKGGGGGAVGRKYALLILFHHRVF